MAPSEAADTRCRYGASCQLASCQFNHPVFSESETANGSSMPASNTDTQQQKTTAATTPANFSNSSAAESTKKIGKCRFGANCKKKKCKYTHPLFQATMVSNGMVETQNDAPQANTNNETTIRHHNAPTLNKSSESPTTIKGKMAKAAATKSAKACRFGVECQFAGCNYSHPPPAATAIASPDASSINTVNHSTTSAETKVKRMCKFGVRCKKKECWFGHPPEWNYSTAEANTNTAASEPTASNTSRSKQIKSKVIDANCEDDDLHAANMSMYDAADVQDMQQDEHELNVLLQEQERQRLLEFASADLTQHLHDADRVQKGREVARTQGEEETQRMANKHAEKDAAVAQTQENFPTHQELEEQLLLKAQAPVGRPLTSTKQQADASRQSSAPAASKQTKQRKRAQRDAPVKVTSPPVAVPAERKELQEGSPITVSGLVELCSQIPSSLGAVYLARAIWDASSQKNEARQQEALFTALGPSEEAMHVLAQVMPRLKEIHSSITTSDFITYKLNNPVEIVDESANLLMESKSVMPSTVQITKSNSHGKHGSEAKKGRPRNKSQQIGAPGITSEVKEEVTAPSIDTASNNTSHARFPKNGLADKEKLQVVPLAQSSSVTAEFDDTETASMSTEELARYKEARNAAKKERKRLEKEAKAREQAALEAKAREEAEKSATAEAEAIAKKQAELAAQAQELADKGARRRELNPYDDVPEDAAAAVREANVQAKQREEERKLQIQEELRISRERAAERKAAKQDRRQSFHDDLKVKFQERTEFWTTEIAKENEFKELIVKLCLAEFKRVYKIDASILRRDNDAMDKLYAAARETYRAIYKNETCSRIIVKGMKQQDLNDRSGVILGWDHAKEAYLVSLDSKKGKSKFEMHISAGNLEHVPENKQASKAKRPVDPVHLVSIPDVFYIKGIMTEIFKSEIDGMRDSPDVDIYLNVWMARRDQEEQEMREAESEIRRQEEEERRRRAEERRRQEREYEQRRREYEARKARYAQWRHEEQARERVRQQSYSFGGAFGGGRHGYHCRCRQCQLQEELLRHMFGGRFQFGGHTFSFGGGGFGGGRYDYDDYFDDDFEEHEEREREAKDAAAAEVLGVSVDATEVEIKTAYRRLARVYHPDKFKPEDHDMTTEEASEYFKDINNANNQLISKYE
ncbi:hypothetical protein MPSEU_000903800 [Mayamaea pseudoterrestris]|nr:hypothetical protein MPSEU_000903800 [Mayamaea pseudoterrestris]